MRLNCDVMNQNFGHQDQDNVLVCLWCGHTYDPKELSMYMPFCSAHCESAFKDSIRLRCIEEAACSCIHAGHGYGE